MCGICGGVNLENPKETLIHMTRRLKHRGPDDEGFFMEGPLALGHRRLSIIDLDGGHQPMFSSDGAQIIVFNGEIYNYQELRETLLKDYHFKTSSDTEVILAAYRKWGKDCLERLNGMFAFALWDKSTGKLWLVRDRLGKKPLYYMAREGRFYFSSEAKAFWDLPSFDGQWDARGMDQYLTYRYVPGERTFYKNIKKLKAGHWMTVDNNGRICQIQQWWDLPHLRDECEVTPARLSRYAEQFQEIFSSAVRLRMIADVPIGLFLSSGIDSVSILAETAQTAVPFSFTLGFNVAGDEVVSAQKTAEDLGGKHIGFYLQDSDFNNFSDALLAMDEPYGDGIILPTYILAREASKFVKVVLTGDGGDELLGGYIHHHFFRNMPPYAGSSICKMAAGFLRFIPEKILNSFFDYPAPMGEAGKERLRHLLSVYPDPYSSYKAIASLFTLKERKNLYTPRWQAYLDDEPDELDEQMRTHFYRPDMTLLDKVLHWDMQTWFPEQTLMKLDRLSMAFGLECRCPYADYRLIEFFFRMPFAAFRALSTNKNVVRQIYQKNRPFLLKKKRPFYIPIHRAYKETFERLLQETLTPGSVKDGGVFNYDFVLKCLDDREHSALLAEKQITSILALVRWMKTPK